MAAADTQQQQQQQASPDNENVAHTANQSAPQSLQAAMSEQQKKILGEVDTASSGRKSVLGERVEAGKEAAEKVVKDGDGGGIDEVVEQTGETQKQSKSRDVEDVVTKEDAVVDMEVDMEVDDVQEDVNIVVEEKEQLNPGEKKAEEMKEMTTEASVEKSAVETEETPVAMEVDSENMKEANEVTTNQDESMADAATETESSKQEEEAVKADSADTGGVESEHAKVKLDEDMQSPITIDSVDTALRNGNAILEEVAEVGEDVAHSPAVSLEAKPYVSHHDHQKPTTSVANGAAISKDVLLTVVSLVDEVVQSVDGEAVPVSGEGESSVILGSPMTTHLSADEALELLEAHQDDDHHMPLLPGHDDGVDADIEAEPAGNSEYQWFDADDDDDGGALIPPPSVVDIGQANDDVFGFGGVVDLTDVSVDRSQDVEINSDESGDTQVLPSNSSSSSSSSSSASSESSSSSSSSASSSEEEYQSSRKRQTPNGGRRLLKFKGNKKQKRVRSAESEKRRHPNRKRKISPPVIPPEFEVFENEAADPILKGTYTVRGNRRACFVGNWGFSEEAFDNVESVSPFEYTSRARVLTSRRSTDRRPVNGKYGGFFKLRQFNGTLVKIREEQVDLQFLPMPASDGEDDEDEDMEGYNSGDEGDEPAASRYTVLGKGKNRFGRFLIRGYLNPETGRLTVKRRYLE